jgi:hypothetical protein
VAVQAAGVAGGNGQAAVAAADGADGENGAAAGTRSAEAKREGEGEVPAIPASVVAAQSAHVEHTARVFGSDGTAALELERQREKRAIERIRVALRELDEESRALARRVDETFHPYWGSIFKRGVELSSFGDQVENYACLYTARVSNFLLYSPLHFFRSPRDYMPHELP